jgi:hypothetical protein
MRRSTRRVSTSAGLAVPDGVSVTEFARLAGLGPSSVRYHLAQGHIRRLRNGKLNPADARMLDRQRQVSAGQKADPRAAKLLRVRVASGAVKTRRLRLQLQEEQARVVDRQALAGVLQERCTAVLARISSWPERYAADLAAAVDVPAEVASEILVEVARISLHELGDIHAEARRAIGQS